MERNIISIQDFGQIVKDDLELLIKGIKDEYSTVWRNIDENLNRNGKFTIEFDSFIVLLNELCFKTNRSDYHPIKGYLPENRMKLFEKFILSEIKIESIHRKPFPRGRELIYSKEMLYYRMLYSIFTQHIANDKSILTIFQDCLELWKIALNTNEFPIEFQIALPDIDFEGDKLELCPNIFFEKISFYSHIHLNLTETSGLKILLIFKTKQKFQLEFIEDPELNNQFDFILDNEDWENKLKSLEEIIFCLRITGLSFVYNGDYDISYPWWFRERKRLFLHPFKSFGKTKISDNKITEFLDYHKYIRNIDFLKDKEFSVVIRRYFQLFGREEWEDSILDQFIILEAIFTFTSKSEITFRLSLNLALFLENSIENFRTTFECINNFYGLRSSIVHGDDWKKQIRGKDILKHLTNKDPNQKIYNIIIGIFNILKTYIDHALKKIILLKNGLIQEEKSKKLFQNIKSYYFLENSDFVKKARKYDQLSLKDTE